MNFKPEKFFIDALNSGSKKEIRRAIRLYIDKNPADSNKETRDALQYLESKGIDIWDEHKEIEGIKPEYQWNRSYIGLLQSDLMYNFSRERMKLILDVGMYVYGKNNNSEIAIKGKDNTNQKPVTYAVSKNQENVNTEKKKGDNNENRTRGNSNSYNYRTDALNNKYEKQSKQYKTTHDEGKNERRKDYDNKREKMVKSNAKSVPSNEYKKSNEEKSLKKFIKNGLGSIFKSK